MSATLFVPCSRGLEGDGLAFIADALADRLGDLVVSYGGCIVSTRARVRAGVYRSECVW